MAKDIFDQMADKWSPPGFARSQAGKVTGEMIQPKTLANLASLGEGPPMRKTRGKAYYEMSSFIPWLRQWAGGE